MIVGLGNPGVEYDRTRHNAGFMVVDLLRARRAPADVPRGRFHALTIDTTVSTPAGGARALLMKPTTYMNRSGLAVAEAVRFYKLQPADDLLVIVDDVDIPLGSIRLRASGGTGGHNGLADITDKLGTSDYARLRVGVGARGVGRRAGDVLARLNAEDWESIQPALQTAADAAEDWAVAGVTHAMNTFNTMPGKPAEPDAPARKPVDPAHDTVGETADPDQPRSKETS